MNLSFLLSLFACTGSEELPVDSDPEADADTDADSDSDTDTDTDTDADTDAAPSIADIQAGTYAIGETVTVEGVVVTSPDSGTGFFAQDTDGAVNSGIWVYYGEIEEWSEAGAGVGVGDEVTLTGTVGEYQYEDGDDTLTELVVSSAADLSVTGTASVPASIELSDADWASKVTLENYEGMLVTVRDLEATHYIEWGEWLFGDNVVIDDLFFDYAEELQIVSGVGVSSVTGNLGYSFGNFKLTPHGASDFVGLTDPACNADLCAPDLSEGDLVINEFMADPTAASDSDAEWIELRNTTDGSIDLRRVTLGDAGGSHVFPDELIIGSGQLVLVGRGDGADWPYTVSPHGWWGGEPQLNNTGDNLQLWADGDLIDETGEYGEVDAGVSRQRDSHGSWCDGTDAIGASGDLGTPGTENNDCG
jgi:hypothetical protein